MEIRPVKTKRSNLVEAQAKVCITGAALGLPGTDHVFSDDNVARILRGESFIDSIPLRLRRAILDKRVTRPVKGDHAGFATLQDVGEVVKLAGRGGELDLAREYGVPEDLVPALDRTTRLAMAAGLDALRDAGIPLVLGHCRASNGSQPPTGWALPESLRDDTGVIFASAFPGTNALLQDVTHYYEDRERRARLEELERLAADLEPGSRGALDAARRVAELKDALASVPYLFDRRFLFKVLSMGHAQLAEYLRARGPNTQVNAACASTTQALALAEDWIGRGRCRRVLVVAADDITSDTMLEWFGTGFLATGAAATDAQVEDAATPFDRRRHGMVVGMGAAALVVESLESARERGLSPICHVLGTVVANSAFHGTRLDMEHMGAVMERLVDSVEQIHGVRREELSRQMVFISHETYTPARGGSAAAEVYALRHVFGSNIDKIVIANTKGFTGHPMGAGIEDVVGVKSLETGVVPPVPNFREQDPELGALNLSRGGEYPVEYALRLAAGFGSQIGMTLLQRATQGLRPRPDALGFANRVEDRPRWKDWLKHVSGTASPSLEVVHRTLRFQAAPVVEQPVPAPVQAPVTDEVQERARALVSQKAGDARDMLALDLEADLGIDPVKQAEGFAAVGTEHGIPQDDQFRFRDHPTLNHLIRFVRERGAHSPALAPVGGAPALPDNVAERVLAIVAQKTGLAEDMLAMDLDLEADLGVDRVKQAEVMSALRAEFGIPRDDKLKLRDRPTLNHVVGLVRAKQTAQSPATPEVKVEAAPALLRRVPVPVLRPPLSLCKATGVRLQEAQRVLVGADCRGVANALVALLQARGVDVLRLEPASGRARVRNRIAEWLMAGPIHGVYWLPGLDVEPDLAALDLPHWRSELTTRVKCLYEVAHAVLAQEHGPFLVSATGLGGLHGYGPHGATGPLGGAITGLVKAVKREHPAALVKCVDFDPACAPADMAERLLAETQGDPGAVEVGWHQDLRWTVGLAECAASGPGLVLGQDSVFVVTGAAGSIVSAIVKDLAQAARGGTFYLLDRVPEPHRADVDLVRLENDREGLRQDLVQRRKAKGERVTPAQVERDLAVLERQQAAQAAVNAVEAAGGKAWYHAVDVLDSAAVARVMDDVRNRSGRVDVLLHAAGVEVSRPVVDKKPDEYDLVFDVKADGWFNVMHAARDLPLGVVVAFGSIAGRFGNGGQTDYAAANDLLAKAVLSLPRSRPQTRAVVLDWTAWSGVGMASRGSIAKEMEEAGIEMLEPSLGVPVVRRELEGGGRGEVVVAGRLGVLLREWDAQGGLDPAASGGARGPMIGCVTAMTADGLRVETTLDPREQPFLDDHQIDGTPVLPGVMGLEAFAELATLPLPGWRVESMEDVSFLTPFKFYRSEPATLFLEAIHHVDHIGMVAQCRLLGRRQVPGQAEAQRTTHLEARVRLVRGAAETTETRMARPARGTTTVSAQDIYRIYFHGPAYRVLEEAWRDGEGAAAILSNPLPPECRPADAGTLLGPWLIETCFQTAGLWEMGTQGRLALPRHVQRIIVHQVDGYPVPRRYAYAERSGDGFNARIVDEEGRVCVELEGYRTSALPSPLDEDVLQPIRSVLN